MKSWKSQIQIYQEKPNYCTPACILMALKRFGTDCSLSQKELHKIVDDSEPKSAEFLRNNGLNVLHARNLTIDNLEVVCNELEGLALCTVAHPLEKYSRTHLCVVDKVTKENVRVINSLQPKDDKDFKGLIKREIFLKWWGRELPQQKHTPNLAVLVVKSCCKFPDFDGIERFS